MRFRRLSALGMSASLLAGCVTTDVSRRGPPGAGGPQIAVSVFASPSDADDGHLFPRPVRTRLVRIDGAAATVVHQSDAAEWRLPAPAPGRYRLEVLSWQRAGGREHRRDHPASETFRVAAGETVRVHVLLSDRRGLLWTLVGLGGVGLVGFLASHTK